jgi:hypothetical protein
MKHYIYVEKDGEPFGTPVGMIDLPEWLTEGSRVLATHQASNNPEFEVLRRRWVQGMTPWHRLGHDKVPNAVVEEDLKEGAGLAIACKLIKGDLPKKPEKVVPDAEKKSWVTPTGQEIKTAELTQVAPATDDFRAEAAKRKAAATPAKKEPVAA